MFPTDKIVNLCQALTDKEEGKRFFDFSLVYAPEQQEWSATIFVYAREEWGTKFCRVKGKDPQQLVEDLFDCKEIRKKLND